VDTPGKSKAVKGMHRSDAVLLVAGTALFAAIIQGPYALGVLQFWTIQAMIGAVLSAPIVLLGRRRAHWRSSDLLAFFLPFATWVALTKHSSVGKSFINLAAEPVLISLTLPVAALIRVGVGSRIDRKLCSISLVAALCLSSAAVYFLTRPLPE
jgi:hypothetical protein